MSQKCLVAAVAIAAVAVTQTEAYRPAPPKPLILDQEQAVYNPNPIRKVFDEEQADWTVNAGINGQVGQPPSWNVGVGVKWDEEQANSKPLPYPSFEFPRYPRDPVHHVWDEDQEQLMKIKDIKKTLNSRPTLLNKKRAQLAAPAPLDEEQADWTVNAGINGQVGQPPSWNVGVGVKWDEEQVYNPNPIRKAFDEEQADWTVNAGISGQAGQPPNWNVGVGVKWDEEQALVNNPEWVPTPRVRPNPGDWSKFVGLHTLDEEQADWTVNAGISGQVGQPPSWNIGVGVKWEEEQAMLVKKINTALATVDHAVVGVQRAAVIAKSPNAILEEERELARAFDTAAHIRKITKAAVQKNLMSEDQLAQVGSKLENLLTRIDQAVDVINHVKDTMDRINDLRQRK